MKTARVALVGMFLFAGGCEAPVEPADSPNVVLIVMDTLRADRLDATRNGKPVMPFLSRMAASGTAYRHAISPSSWTKPTMASLFTGLSPEAHGVIYSARQEDPANPTSDRLSDAHLTLAEQLQARGYRAWAYQTNANLTAALGFAQGFVAGDYHFANGAPASQVTSLSLAASTEFAAPFFLYAHYMEPHAPYHVPEGLAEALGPLPEMTAYDGEVLNDDGRFMAYYMDQVQTALSLQGEPTLPDLSPEGKEAVRHRYDLECLVMDRAIEGLVTGIQAVHPNTVFLFVSDHGEEFWERGGMGHGTTLFQEQVHVPYFWVGPKVPQQEIETTVSTQMFGQQLLGYLDGKADWENPVPSAPVYSFSRGPWPALGVNVQGLYRDGYSYLVDRRTETTSLFHLERDPAEAQDLATTEPEQVGAFAALLERHRALEAGAVDGAPLSEADRERLEALGYVDNP